MSDVLIEAFDQYGTNSASTANLRLAGYTINSTTAPGKTDTTYCGAPSWGSAPTGPYCLVSGWGASSTDVPYALRYFLTNTTTSKLFISCRFAMDDLPSLTKQTCLFEFRGSTDSQKVAYIGITPTGCIEIYDGTTNLVVGITPVIFKAKEFHFIEMSLDMTTGVCQLRVDDPYANNNAAMVSATFNSAGITYFTYIRVMPQFNTAMPGGIYMDDLYIRDDTGTFNNSWLGDRRILWVPVTKDTTSETWTVPASETYSIGTLPSDTTVVSSIKFVQPLHTTSSTATEIGKFIGPLGAISNGTSHSVTTAGSFWGDLFNVDPDTSLQLTPASLVRATFSINLS